MARPIHVTTTADIDRATVGVGLQTVKRRQLTHFMLIADGRGWRAPLPQLIGSRCRPMWPTGGSMPMSSGICIYGISKHAALIVRQGRWLHARFRSSSGADGRRAGDRQQRHAGPATTIGIFLTNASCRPSSALRRRRSAGCRPCRTAASSSCLPSASPEVSSSA